MLKAMKGDVGTNPTEIRCGGDVWGIQTLHSVPMAGFN